MPIYEFECQDCGKDFEQIVRLSDPEPPLCPQCGGKKTRRIMSACAARSKGASAGASCGSSPGGFS